MYSPPLASVSPGTRIPFLLRLVVRTKSEGDMTAVAPALPLDGSGNGPTFKVKRLVRNRTKKSKIGTTKLDLTAKLAVPVEWSGAHLAASSLVAATSSSVSPSIAGPGHAWTSPTRDAKASFPYSSTALLSGQMTLPLSPSFELPTLSVTYALHLRIPLEGLRNTLDEHLCVVRAVSGVTQAELASLDVAEANRPAVGTRRAVLLQTLGEVQGDEREVEKLDEMSRLPGYGEEDEESWVDEKGGKETKGMDQSHELPEYDEALEGVRKVKLADEKR